jgi:hypothetical protein
LWTRHPERLWEATTTMADPAGRVVPVLEPAMALALALVHLNKDRFAYLGSYGEVVRILGDAALDWDTFDRFITDEGLRVPVWSSLAEVVDRLGLDGPIPIDRAATRGWRGRLWRGLWPSRSRLRGNEGRRSHRQRQVLIPGISQARTAEVAAELRRRAVPPRSLLDLHRPELSGHRYLRRVTLDRLWGRRHR